MYNDQYGTDFLCVVPTNIYGKNDQYDLNNSHVVAALIRKAVEAKESGNDFVVFGSGNPIRSFIHAYDIAVRSNNVKSLLQNLMLWVLYK